MEKTTNTLLRASSVRSFHETPKKWYENHILGLDKFEGNTATYLGTVVHHFAEAFYSLDVEFDPEAILAECGADIDVETIRSEYPAMCEVLQKEYLEVYPEPDFTELYNRVDYNEHGISFQGTFDAIIGSTLIDYKTSGKAKSKMDEYSQQLNIYAYLVSLKDIHIDTLRVVNVVRPTKTLPPRVLILECKADAEAGEKLVKLMVNKTKLAVNNPDFRDLIFGDNPYSFLSDGFNIETRVVKDGKIPKK